MTTYGVDRSGAAGGTGTATTPIDENLIDAKGDLIVGTANNVADRLAVGANDTMLMAASAQATGVKWATPTEIGTALATGMSAKATAPVDSDRVLIGDSEASNTGKYVRVDSLLGATNDLPEDTAPGTDDYLLSYDVSASAPKKVKPENLPVAARKNAIINGGFSIGQRRTSFTAATNPSNGDDNYTLDRWNLLSDGSDIVDVAREATTVPTGGIHALSLDVETANKKFGVIQFIEQANCKGLIGNTVTLSFKARKGGSNATVGTLRAAILAWDSTADTLTSDVVSAWNASGTNPTLVANWTYENTPADLTLTTSFQTFSVSATIDTASAKNIGVFLYYNNADGTVGDFIYITDVQLEIGSVATDFEQRSIQEEVELCQRYFEKSYNLDVAPGTTTDHGAVGARSTGGNIFLNFHFLTRKRAQPSVVIYNPVTGTTGEIRNTSVSTNHAATVSWESERGFVSDIALTDGHQAYGHFTASAEL